MVIRTGYLFNLYKKVSCDHLELSRGEMVFLSNSFFIFNFNKVNQLNTIFNNNDQINESTV